MQVIFFAIHFREDKHEYDFLSSIELLVMDQADVFLMQNWEHITVGSNHVKELFICCTHYFIVCVSIVLGTISRWSVLYTNWILNFNPGPSSLPNPKPTLTLYLWKNIQRLIEHMLEQSFFFSFSIAQFLYTALKGACKGMYFKKGCIICKSRTFVDFASGQINPCFIPHNNWIPRVNLSNLHSFLPIKWPSLTVKKFHVTKVFTYIAILIKLTIPLQTYGHFFPTSMNIFAHCKFYDHFIINSYFLLLLQHIMEHLHLQPKDSHDVDFSRVRMWALNKW